MRLIISDVQNSSSTQSARRPRLKLPLVFFFGCCFSVSAAMANSPDWAEYDRLLQRYVVTGTIDGVKRVIYFKLIPNPHARRPLPTWLAEHIDKTRAETKRLTTFKD